MRFIKSRSIELGHSIGASHGEGYISENKLKTWKLLCQKFIDKFGGELTSQDKMS